MTTKYFKYVAALMLPVSLTFIFPGCEQFVEIGPPRTALVTSTVFESDATANAAMIDIYYELSSGGFASGSSESITYLATISSDEQVNYISGSDYQEFYENDLTPKNAFILTLWSKAYKTIYKCNAMIEGVVKSNGLTEAMKIQLEGEAKFMRAFCYFYLVNLYGSVPLATDTDYRVNATISRTLESGIYEQIIKDLIDAQNLLPDNYSFSNDERIRANKGAATALLARTYLHTGDWENAEVEASRIIQNAGLYSLVSDLKFVFLSNNTEAILQFHNTFYPFDYLTFRVFEYGPDTGALRPEFIDNFEIGDQRKTIWIRSVIAGTTTYFFPGKYKLPELAAEYSTLFRLAELYLIRAEARAHQEKISGSQEDLNMIRQRAGLSDTPATDRASLLTAIEHERIVELFTEQGLRWLDLKRTNRADAVLAPIKGSTWHQTDALYPIPEAQMLNDPAMANAQNPGY